MPVFLEAEESLESALDGSAYAQVRQVIRALRAHDDHLATYLDTMRIHMGADGQDDVSGHAVGLQPSRLRPDWLSLSGVPVPDGFASAIQVRAVQAATSSWSEYYGAARTYFREHGNLHVHESFQTATGLRLGKWVKKQLADRNSGMLSIERVGLLDEINMVWSRRDAKWQRVLKAARVYAEQHGHLPHKTGHPRPEGLDFRRWLSDQRKNARAGRLTPDRHSTLEALDPKWLARRNTETSQ